MELFFAESQGGKNGCFLPFVFNHTAYACLHLLIVFNENAARLSQVGYPNVGKYELG